MRLALVFVALIATCFAESIPMGGRYGFGFGANTQYQLGRELNSSLNAVIALHPYELEIFESTPIVNVSCGLTHVLATTEWGSVYRWGSGNRGQLGGFCADTLDYPEMLVLLDPADHRSVNNAPSFVSWTKTVTNVAAGALHSLAVVDHKFVYSWGDNRYLQLGTDIPPRVTYHLHPVPKPHNYTITNRTTHFRRTNVTRTNSTHSAAQNTTANTSSQNGGGGGGVAKSKEDGLVLLDLGVGVGARNFSSSNDTVVVEKREFTSSPLHVITVPSTFGIKSIHAAMHRSAALTTNGEVWVWGDNRDGLIGIDTDEDAIYPAQVVGDFSYVIDLCMGTNFFVALDGDHRVWVWGSNRHNQLGLGPNAQQDVDTPTEIQFFREKKIEHVTCGFNHAILWSDTTKRVFAFGDNEYGQLGLGDTDPRDCPEEIEFLHGTVVRALSLGRGHSFLLTGNGGVLAWGLNNQGQLGMGDTTTRSLPTRVLSIEGLGLFRAAACNANTFAWTGPELPFAPPNREVPASDPIPQGERDPLPAP